MSKAGIQARFSTNCIAAVPYSKPVKSGMVSSSVAAATRVANQRAVLSRGPMARVTRPPRIVSQTSRLSKGIALWRGSGVTSRSWSVQGTDEHGQQHDQAEDHREGVVVEVAGLGTAADAGGKVDDPRRTIDEHSVDDPGVEPPEHPPQRVAAASQSIDPQAVEAVLVLEDPHRQGQGIARLARQVRPEQVHEGRQCEATQG